MRANKSLAMPVVALLVNVSLHSLAGLLPSPLSPNAPMPTRWPGPPSATPGVVLTTTHAQKLGRRATRIYAYTKMSLLRAPLLILGSRVAVARYAAAAKSRMEVPNGKRLYIQPGNC